jgi:hypothetical protein
MTSNEKFNILKKRNYSVCFPILLLVILKIQANCH